MTTGNWAISLLIVTNEKVLSATLWNVPIGHPMLPLLVGSLL